MNRFLLGSSILFFASVIFSCERNEGLISAFHIPRDMTKEGKLLSAPILKDIYNKSNVDSEICPRINQETIQAIRQQRKLLERKRRGKKHFKIGGLKFGKEDLERTVDALENWGSSAFVPPSEYFNTYLLSGKDQKGNVLFTGYYSPLLQVSSVGDETFRYPIYTRPQGDGPFPTRYEIYKEGALYDKGLELAYAKSMLDIQKMQLQGSGYVQYRDGKIHLFSYGGSNGHPRKSIQRYFLNNYGKPGQGITLEKLGRFLRENRDKADEIVFHNPSYVFFIKNEKRKSVNGSGNVPLQAQISIATDKRYIPTGACMFAMKPSIQNKEFSHVPSVLLAQDVGGGIKGTGHVDLYTGVGLAGRKKAALSHYGQMWLLLAK